MIIFMLGLGYCHSTHHENFNTATPVFEIDGDFVPLSFAATMWDSTDSICDTYRNDHIFTKFNCSTIRNSSSFPNGDVSTNSNS